jgi:hypothetical protein
MNLVAGCVMEGSMVFCQNNFLEHSMSFHGDCIKRCLLTHRVSQILYLTKLISEIKYIQSNGLFTKHFIFGQMTYSVSINRQIRDTVSW